MKQLLSLFVALCLSLAAYGQSVSELKAKAQAGDAGAQSSLGFRYHTGQGISQNYALAVYWYRKAAEQGDAYAQANLGVCYYNGQGVAKNHTQAEYWWHKAAKQGDADAQRQLDTYFKGNNVAQSKVRQSGSSGSGLSPKTAEEQLKLAANYYERGDYANAVRLFRKVAEQGYAGAQFNLGICYNEGHGVTKDYSQAVYWYRKAAEQGDADAQYNLGLCYYNGDGITKDYAQARYWIKKAKEQGNDDAIKALKLLDFSE